MPYSDVIILRRTAEDGSEIVGRSRFAEFTILRGARSDALHACISPDGSKIAFVATNKIFVGSLRVEAFTTERDISDRRWVTDARRVRRGEWTGATLLAESASWGLSWAPDSRALVFTRPYPVGSVNFIGDVIRIEVRSDGTPGRTTQLTNLTGSSHRDGRPTYNPDGSLILFIRNDGIRPSPGLYIMSASGGEPRRMEVGEGWNQVSWAPDGRRIVGSRLTGGDRPGETINGLFYFDYPETGRPQKIYYSKGQESFPQISPNGAQLAFATQYRVTRSLIVPKLCLGSIGLESSSSPILPMPTILTPPDTTTEEVPLQYIRLPYSR